MKMTRNYRLLLAAFTIFSLTSIIKYITHVTKPSPYIFPSYENKTYVKQVVNTTNTLRTHLTDFPKIIYMFWDEGWATAPYLQKLCLKSFQRENLDYTILALNLSESERLIERPKHYSDVVWNSATIQAKSDIIRVELLAKYGGIWADATVYCNRPLSSWLDNSLLPVNFLSYERRDELVNANNYPWIASWFLVSRRNSTLVHIWREAVRKAWNTNILPTESLGYFWLHQLFRDLTIVNLEFKYLFEHMPFLDASGSHCIGAENEIPHVYKAGAQDCILKMIPSFV